MASHLRPHGPDQSTQTVERQCRHPVRQPLVIRDVWFVPRKVFGNPSRDPDLLTTWIQAVTSGHPEVGSALTNIHGRPIPAQRSITRLATFNHGLAVDMADRIEPAIPRRLAVPRPVNAVHTDLGPLQAKQLGSIKHLPLQAIGWLPHVLAFVDQQAFHLRFWRLEKPGKLASVRPPKHPRRREPRQIAQAMQTQAIGGGAAQQESHATLILLRRTPYRQTMQRPLQRDSLEVRRRHRPGHRLSGGAQAPSNPLRPPRRPEPSR